MKKLAGFLVWMVGFALAVSSGGAMAATECDGLITGKVTGSVVVNDGDVCFLGGNMFVGTVGVGARVSGGVRVNAGGVLFVCASTIDGGIVADGAASIVVGAEEIDCDGGVISGGVRISNTEAGDLDPEGPPSIALENSRISGAVHLTGNHGRISVANDRISGGLFCSNNAFDLEDETLPPQSLPPSIVTGRVTCEFE